MVKYSITTKSLAFKILQKQKYLHYYQENLLEVKVCGPCHWKMTYIVLHDPSMFI